MELLKEDFVILKEFIRDWNKPKYGRELDKKIKYSQKFIANRLKKLEEQGILKSEKKSNIKEYQINKKNPITKDIIIITEINKKIEYFKKQKELIQIIKEENNIIGIFGSQANNTANKESDIDIFIIGNNKINYEKIGKIYGFPISTKKFTKKEFKKMIKEKNHLGIEIIKNHILIKGIEEFVTIEEEYYGNN